MKTIAHISDLHFGAEDPEVIPGLRKDISRINPSLIVVSGDLTQRARRREFKAAKGFLSTLPGPQLIVPGNHDIPLYDVVRRFFSPLRRFRSYITEDLCPAYMDEEMVVFGLNTARSLTWKSGRLSRSQIEELGGALVAQKPSLFKVVVTHHPFIPPPEDRGAGIDLVGRASLAMKVLERGRVDLMLAGHLHHGYTGDARTFYPSGQRSIVVAQAGTALSHRVRGEPNTYNLITLEKNHIRIVMRIWNRVEFMEHKSTSYRMKNGKWEVE
ncbi:MAG: metallophosphoesterase family protein [Opitutales bacterium]